MMGTEIRSVAGAFAAVLSLSRSANCFVLQTSPSTFLRRSAAPLVASSSQQLQQGRHGHDCGTHCERTLMMGECNHGGWLEDGMDRRQAVSRAWRAALSLSTLGAAVAGTARPARAGVLEFLLPPQDGKTIIEVGEVDKEISFEDFERSLLKGEVKKCEFFGPNFDKAVLQLADGSKALINEGYPKERSFSDDSPMKVVGLLRNAGVPYTTQFKMTAYNKPKSYKSSETLEAESRQRTEDATMERLMSE